MHIYVFIIISYHIINHIFFEFLLMRYDAHLLQYLTQFSIRVHALFTLSRFLWDVVSCGRHYYFLLQISIVKQRNIITKNLRKAFELFYWSFHFTAKNEQKFIVLSWLQSCTFTNHLSSFTIFQLQPSDNKIYSVTKANHGIFLVFCISVCPVFI